MNIETKVKQTLARIKLSAPKDVPPNALKGTGEGKKDKILVALSGGKDSAVTAYLLKKFGFNLQGFHINLGMGRHSKDCLKATQKLCKNLQIHLHTYDIKKEMGGSMCYLQSTLQSKKSLKNCAICGVIKKWILNKESRKFKVDKIATGHNLDDEAQTFLINIFKGSPELSANIGPITQNTKDKKFISRIKPLFYIPEDEIKKYSKQKKLPVVYAKCPCAFNSYRIQVRKFLNTLSNKDKQNIIKNFESVSKKLQKNKKTQIKYCEICGEPSRNKICKRCGLIRN